MWQQVLVGKFFLRPQKNCLCVVPGTRREDIFFQGLQLVYQNLITLPDIQNAKSFSHPIYSKKEPLSDPRYPTDRDQAYRNTGYLLSPDGT